jgi:hypothetical protein
MRSATIPFLVKNSFTHFSLRSLSVENVLDRIGKEAKAVEM